MHECDHGNCGHPVYEARQHVSLQEGTRPAQGCGIFPIRNPNPPTFFLVWHIARTAPSRTPSQLTPLLPPSLANGRRSHGSASQRGQGERVHVAPRRQAGLDQALLHGKDSLPQVRLQISGEGVTPEVHPRRVREQGIDCSIQCACMLHLAAGHAMPRIRTYTQPSRPPNALVTP